MTALDSPPRRADAGGAPPRRPWTPAAPDTRPRTEVYTPRRTRRKRAAQYLPLAVAGALDAILAIAAFNAVLRDLEILSWLCALGFSLLTVGTAVLGGIEAKLRHRALSAALGAASSALIGAVFILRMTAATIQASATPSYAGSPTSTAGTTDLGVAIVMALVMLAGSIAAWVDGFKSTSSPEAAEYQASQTHLTQLEIEGSDCAANISRLTDEAAWATYQLDRVDRDLLEALEGLDAMTLELQAHARFEIARVVGDPSATSGLDLPIPPANPNPPASDRT